MRSDLRDAVIRKSNRSTSSFNLAQQMHYLHIKEREKVGSDQNIPLLSIGNGTGSKIGFCLQRSHFSPLVTWKNFPLGQQANVYVKGSYFGWVCRPRIYDKLVSRLYFLDIQFFRFSENIYEMHACSFIEKEEQWKFVDQILLFDMFLATRLLLPDPNINNQMYDIWASDIICVQG